MSVAVEKRADAFWFVVRHEGLEYVNEGRELA
jgi:hypothetical protein